MSLTVSQDLLDAAERGDVSDAEFIQCVRTSLPYAWDLVSRVVGELEASGDEFADNTIPPPSESDRGQLLRALASDAIRGGLERHFAVNRRSRTVTGWPRSECRQWAATATSGSSRHAASS